MKRIFPHCWILVLLVVSFACSSPRDNRKENDRQEHGLRVGDVKPVPPDRKAGWDAIIEGDTREYLEFLASDRLAGRETTTREYELAARFVSARMSSWGIEPAVRTGNGDSSNLEGERISATFFQKVAIGECLADHSRIFIEIKNGSKSIRRPLILGEDYKFAPVRSFDLRTPVVSVGYGLREADLGRDDYHGVDVKGKAVMVFGGMPAGFLSDLDPQRCQEMKWKYGRMNHHDFYKFKIAHDRGAAAVLYVVGNWRKSKPGAPTQKGKEDFKYPPVFKRRLHLPRSSILPISEAIPVVVISTETADAFLAPAGKSVKGVKKKLTEKPLLDSRDLTDVVLEIRSRIETREKTCMNVLGVLRGSDPRLRDEVVIIGAHLDHLGRVGNHIYNGANDNASGAVAVLQAAKAFAGNPSRPRRSILFAFWTGEEEGLLGSRHYVDHPVFPIKQIHAYINLDAIGCACGEENRVRMAAVYKRETGMELPVDLDLSSLVMPVVRADAPWLSEAVQKCNGQVGLSLFIRKIYRTEWHADYAPFDWRGIPWLSFFSARSPHHHQPTDTTEKVCTRLVQRIARLVYLSAFDLADL